MEPIHKQSISNMEPEVTVICVDNSALLTPMVGGCGLDNAQAEAIALYCEEKLKAHPDNEVGLVAMGPLKSTGFVRPTRDLHRICYAVKALLYYGLSCIPIASALFYFNSSNLPKRRLLVFCGGRLSMDSAQLKRYATKFKESDVAVDVVNFGVQRWPMTKKQLLQAFVADADNNGNSRYLYAPIGSSTSLAQQILSSPLAPGVPMQKKKKVVSDNRILNKLVNICITTYLSQNPKPHGHGPNRQNLKPHGHGPNRQNINPLEPLGTNKDHHQYVNDYIS